MRIVYLWCFVFACSTVASSYNEDDFEESDRNYMADERSDRNRMAEENHAQQNVTEERTVTSEKRSDGIHHKVTITKKVRVPYTVHVEKRVPKIIEVPVDKPFNVYVPKPYPVFVEKKVPFEIKVPLPQPYTVEKKVPYPVKVLVDKPYTVQVPKPYPVEVEKNYEFTVEKKIPVEVKVPVERPYPVHVLVEKEVKFPVEKKVPVPVKVPYDKPVPIHVQKYVPVNVDKPVPYTVEQISTYPVHVPLKIPIKVHHVEGAPVSNDFHLQQLDWSEGASTQQKISIKGFQHQQTTGYRAPNRQPFSGGHHPMAMHFSRGAPQFTRHQMHLPFFGGQGNRSPHYQKPMLHHAQPNWFQNYNPQLRTRQPLNLQAHSSYEVKEAQSPERQELIQRPNQSVQLQNQNLQYSDTFNSQTSNATVVTSAPNNPSFMVSQTVIHNPSTPVFQPLVQQPRHQPFTLNSPSYPRGLSNWKPIAQVPSSTFFKQPQNVASKQQINVVPSPVTFFSSNFNAAHQGQKNAVVKPFGSISVSPMAEAFSAHTIGQSKTQLQTAQTPLGNSQIQNSGNPQQPSSFFGSKTLLGQNEHSYSSSITHEQSPTQS